MTIVMLFIDTCSCDRIIILVMMRKWMTTTSMKMTWKDNNWQERHKYNID